MDPTRPPGRDRRPTPWPALTFVATIVRTVIDAWLLFRS